MRNIRLAYILQFLHYPWFWLGVWVLYYLQFTNYAGIGIIEMVMISTSVFMEIPTGAIADLLGKKRTLIASYVLCALGHFVMGSATSFQILLLSTFIFTTGSALHSGTMEAFVFDSLKEKKKEKKFPRIMAHMQSITLIALASCGLIGGWLYTLSPRLPFFVATVLLLIGALLCFFLQEPSVDTDTFSLKNFITQTRKGFTQLLTPKLRNIFFFLVGSGIAVVVCGEALNDILVTSYGLRPEYLGIFAAGVSLFGAVSVQVAPALTRRFAAWQGIMLISAVFATSLILSPLFGVVIGIGFIGLRVGLQAIHESLASVAINEGTPSAIRATTISTYNMVRRLPYVALAYILGVGMEQLSASIFAMWLGIAMMVFLVGWGVTRKMYAANSR